MSIPESPEPGTPGLAASAAAGLAVVLGAGPVGSTVARRLAGRGVPVRIVSRSGQGPEVPLVDRHRADATDPAQLATAVQGASVVVNALNPPYHRWAELWPPLHHAVIDASARVGAVVVLVDNLYAYGDTHGAPMHAGLPQLATGTKGRVRAAMADELLAAHRDGRVRGVIVRASDYLGPLVRQSSFGERVVPRVLAGRKVALVGNLDQPHAVSYVPDVAATIDAVAHDARAWGAIWHVPSAAPTQRELVARMAQLAGEPGVKIGTVPRAGLAIAGLFSPMVRELAEVRYQFTAPWLVDATATQRTFGIDATPLDTAIAATLAWYRDGTWPAPTEQPARPEQPGQPAPVRSAS